MANDENTVLNLNKMSLAEAVAEQRDASVSDTYETLEAAFDIIAARVAQGGRVSITNFGSWGRPEKKSRRARNPQTGESLIVPDRKGVKFTPSPRWVGFANSDDPSATTIRKQPKGPSNK